LISTKIDLHLLYIAHPLTTITDINRLLIYLLTFCVLFMTLQLH